MDDDPGRPAQGVASPIAECRLCGGDATPIFRVRDFNRRVTDEFFSYHRCRACGCVFISPIPHDLSRHYPPAYYPMPGSLAELRAMAERERFKLELVTAVARSGRLLEIGPSVGGFAYLAKTADFDVTTIEMDPACCEFLRTVAGVSAVQSADPASALHDLEPFDVIAMWHVIEHLPDPWKVLRAAAARLRPRGVLAIAAPNPESLQSRLFGRYWMHLDAPRHLHLIPIAELTRRAEAEGLVLWAVTTRDQGTLVGDWAGWQASIANRLGNLARHLPTGRAGQAVAVAVRPLERAHLRGSAYTALFTNPGPGAAVAAGVRP